jgi:hypothetical protein
LAPSALLPDDLKRLASRGISGEEAARQLALFVAPPAPVRLLRPCTPGDGILRLEPGRAGGLLALFEEARRAGRGLSFVPASGAATRMFGSLLALLDSGAPGSREDLAAAAREGDRPARDLLAFLEGLPDLALAEALEAELARRGLELDSLLASDEHAPLLRALLEEEGLGYAALPKGLIPFHRAPEGPRTALAEQLAEAAAYLSDGEGRCRLHLTVSAAHRGAFEGALEALRPGLEGRLRVRFEVALSEQSPATDTLAVEADGRPLRDEEGRLVLRPGGHGALLENLAACGGDLVFLKNIDNVVPDGRREEPLRWKRLLGGLLLEIQERCFAYLERLEAGELSGEELEEALAWAASRFGPLEGPGEAPALLRRRLERPLRVCGMVPNEGEPGGGPFWVAGPEGGESPQIVEGSQVDPADAAQREILASATHFNPVDLVCGLRDRKGRLFDLRRFVDPAAVFLSEKTWRGRSIRALERPGLWNGAMAGWNTVFVEVPAATFHPVKTVLDLLRPAHRPAGSG